MTQPSSNNGHDETTASDPSLDRFVHSLRAGLPRLSGAAMGRVERAMRGELDRVYPPVPLALPGVPGVPGGQPWHRWAAIAAMFVLVTGFAWMVSIDRTVPTPPAVAARVVDEFEVVIEPPPSPPAQASQWDALMTSLERYASLIGLERFARR